MEEKAITLSQESLEVGVLQSCPLMRTPYPSVDLAKMAKGFPKVYANVELDSFEEMDLPHLPGGEA